MFSLKKFANCVKKLASKDFRTLSALRVVPSPQISDTAIACQHFRLCFQNAFTCHTDLVNSSSYLSSSVRHSQMSNLWTVGPSPPDIVRKGMWFVMLKVH